MFLRMESTSPTPTEPTDIFAPSYIAGNLNQQTMTMPPKRRSKTNDKTKTLLPIDFEPSEYSIICGNKRAFFNSHGNRRFRAMCQVHLAEYMNAPSKHEKSFVVTKVMKALREACPVGAFVAFEKGHWWEVSDRASREKVGTFFRDCLSDNYKSSSKNKIAQRKKKRIECPPDNLNVSLYSSPVESAKPLVAPAATVPALPLTSLAPIRTQCPPSAPEVSLYSSPWESFKSADHDDYSITPLTAAAAMTFTTTTQLADHQDSIAPAAPALATSTQPVDHDDYNSLPLTAAAPTLAVFATSTQSVDHDDSMAPLLAAPFATSAQPVDHGDYSISTLTAAARTLAPAAFATSTQPDNDDYSITPLTTTVSATATLATSTEPVDSDGYSIGSSTGSLYDVDDLERFSL